MKKNFIVPLIGLAVFLILMAFKKGDNPGAKIEGVLYMQTNGIKNEIIRYARMENGSLKEVQRISTGGAGSGTYKPIYDHPNDPNAFEGAKSIILTSDHKWLFTTNGGNNSVFYNFVHAGFKRKQALLRSNLPGINPVADEVISTLRFGFCQTFFIRNYF